MIEREILITIFQLRFIQGLSYRKISSELSIHRDTVKKYIDIMEDNLSTLKSSLTINGIADVDSFDEFIRNNWEDYIDEIVSFKHSRKKRKLTPEIIEEVSTLTRILNTTSAMEIYDYIQSNLLYSNLGELSYSSIWRALESLK